MERRLPRYLKVPNTSNLAHPYRTFPKSLTPRATPSLNISLSDFGFRFSVGTATCITWFSAGSQEELARNWRGFGEPAPSPPCAKRPGWVYNPVNSLGPAHG